MPTVNITSTCTYNAAVEVKGVLTGDKGVPITAYTVEVVPNNGSEIRIATNVPSSGGEFAYYGTTPGNTPIALPCTVRVITNRQAQNSKTVDQPCNPIIGFLPAGSYQDSCRYIKVELTCNAEDGNGGSKPAAIDLTQLVCPNLYNEYGVLKTDPHNVAQDGFEPGGSWKQSCSEIHVKLTCEARNMDGNWVAASFDLTGLKQADLWNENGTLHNSVA